jgi:hypothetical protein
MAEPMDAVTAIHNALRHDMRGIDAAALAWARGGPALTAERFGFFSEVLAWHALGEEKGIFPALERVAPSVAEAYERDHRALDEAAGKLSAAVAAGDPLEAARAAAAFRFHHDLHLAKEDAHLYRLFRERIAIPEQGKAVGIMAGTVPQDRFPQLVGWWMSLVGDDDRENMMHIWQTMLPAPAFAGVAQIVRKAVGDGGWAELTRRFPAVAKG